MPFRFALLLVVAALAISGCGRRGALEDPDRVENATVGGAAIPGTADFDSPGAETPDAERPEQAPDRPFVLDPLI